MIEIAREYIPIAHYSSMIAGCFPIVFFQEPWPFFMAILVYPAVIKHGNENGPLPNDFPSQKPPLIGDLPSLQTKSP